jgi:hypothetical protein
MFNVVLWKMTKKYYRCCKWYIHKLSPTSPFMQNVFDFPLGTITDTSSSDGQLMLTRHLTDQDGNYEHAYLTTASEGFAQQVEQSAIQQQIELMNNSFDATSDLITMFNMSSKLFTARSNESIWESYLSFTYKCNLAPLSIVPSFKRSIIASLKLVDTAKICLEMQDNAPVHTLDYFEKTSDNVYGDYSEWEKVLQPLSFEEDSTREYLFGEESNFGNKLPTIKYVLDTLQHIGASKMCITDLLKVYLLTNIKNVSSRVAIQTVLADKMPSTFDASGGAFVFTGCMADVRFTEQQFHNDLVWFMRNLEVSETFQTDLTFFVKGHDQILCKSSLLPPPYRVGRVSLRDRVEKNARRSTGVCTPGVAAQTERIVAGLIGESGSNLAASPQLSQIEEDSLRGWTLRARIPPSISHKHKLLGYVLMAQTNFADPSNALQKHFMHDKEVYTNMKAQRVCRPHTPVVVEFLRLLDVHVTPFDELNAFRNQCFTDFSHTDSKKLSWLKYLQLYIAAYQHEDVWVSVWRSFCTVISHQVLVSVGNFKANNAYAVDTVADICMGVVYDKEDDLA